MFHNLNTPYKKEVLQEIEAIEKTREELMQKLNNAKTLNQYTEDFLSKSSGREFLDKVTLQTPSKILDIGFGRGESALYLAQLGHEVHAIEPSPLNCELLRQGANKFGYKNSITIYQGTAEDFEQVDVKEFDLCLFNASLHHCDEPIHVLQMCKEKLKANGLVLAINEPILKFYRTKKWYFKQLKENPVKFGHYGGNEHIYYYSEYIEMFKCAHFASVEGLFHERHQNPRLLLQEEISKKVGNQYVHSDKKLLFKYCVLLALQKLQSKPLQTLGKKLSLFPFSFLARKTL